MRKMKISEALLKGEKIANDHDVRIQRGAWLGTDKDGNGNQFCFACAVGTVALACGASPKMAADVDYTLATVLKKINGHVDRVGNLTKVDGHLLQKCITDGAFTGIDAKFEPLALADYLFEEKSWSVKKIAAWFKKHGM